MKYTLKRIIGLTQETDNGEIIYITEALDSDGGYVVVKMTEAQVEAGGIKDE